MTQNRKSKLGGKVDECSALRTAKRSMSGSSASSTLTSEGLGRVLEEFSRDLRPTVDEPDGKAREMTPREAFVEFFRVLFGGPTAK